MDQATALLVQELKRFKQTKLRDLAIDRMLFFGSRARGRSHEDSDVDLVVVSERFRRQHVLDRSPTLYHRWDLDYPVDFLCLTPEEFQERASKATIIRTAVEEGIEI